MSEANNGCPEVTPAQLLAEEPSEEDCRKLEQVMGRFNSTTGFLIALKSVLVDLEGFQEAVALEKFLPIMAHVEAKAMSGDSEPAVKSIQDYPRVENGQLLNSGEVPATVQQLHDYLGASPSPNGE